MATSLLKQGTVNSVLFLSCCLNEILRIEAAPPLLLWLHILCICFPLSDVILSTWICLCGQQEPPALWFVISTDSENRILDPMDSRVYRKYLELPNKTQSQGFPVWRAAGITFAGSFSAAVLFSQNGAVVNKPNWPARCFEVQLHHLIDLRINLKPTVISGSRGEIPGVSSESINSAAVVCPLHFIFFLGRLVLDLISDVY